MAYPTLNFPPIHLRARRNADGRTEVFDRVRGRWLVLTPEEWVRRHVVEYMIEECGFAPQQIIEEYSVLINGMAQRADIVATDRLGNLSMVVECKEPNIKLDGEVLAQVVRYNSVLHCEYIVLTNGLQTYCYQQCDNKYTPICHFPHSPK